MIRFRTASGAVYLKDGATIKRENPNDAKRGDGDWQRLVHEPNIEIGFRAVLVMESLAPYGTDDYGTPQEFASDVTTRITTPIQEIEEVTT